ncbi:nucleoside deaminase [Reinekea marina]|uniref:Nucleoside deaminase n=1 Tax=Reinekea marina TaxID=1310421 RepID=A0ABV7WMQ0_9GAMM|nr:nucleoside deaminase [Reinekea marina]MDN3649540.1 nucleoside deaminase [Reinekea marina]
MHEQYMKIALEEAKKAFELGNLPIGCCIVLNGEVIARAHNLVDTNQSDLLHAELTAIRSCENLLFKNKRQATLYSTLEPCSMCAGAFVSASIGQLVYAADDNFVGSIALLKQNRYYDERLNVVTGICKEESQQLLNEYVELHKGRAHLSSKAT